MSEVAMMDRHRVCRYFSRELSQNKQVILKDPIKFYEGLC